MSESLHCWNCGADLAALPQPFGRHDQCEQCAEMLHCCRMCKHFDTRATDQCHEESADPPTNKEVGNFCEYFFPVNRNENPRRTDDMAADKFNSLFGDEPDNASTGKTNPLDDLFGD